MVQWILIGWRYNITGRGKKGNFLIKMAMSLPFWDVRITEEGAKHSRSELQSSKSEKL